MSIHSMSRTNKVAINLFEPPHFKYNRFGFHTYKIKEACMLMGSFDKYIFLKFNFMKSENQFLI